MSKRPLQKVLFEIGKAVGSDDDLDSLLGRTSQLVNTLVDAEACSFLLLDGDGTRLVGRAAYGENSGDVATISFRIETGVAGWVVQNSEPILIDDVKGDSRFATLPGSSGRIHSMACVPVIAGNRAVGAITATSSKLNAFSADDVGLLGMVASTIAIDFETHRVRRLSTTDPLTGAYNHDFLASYLPQAVGDAHKRLSSLAIAIINIDKFSSINDRFGKDVGDRVLAGIAKRLRSATREDDLLVRVKTGGFLVVLPGTGPTMAAHVAERMRARLAAQAFDIDGSRVEVFASIGVADLGPDDKTGDSLLNRASAACLKAKEQGRNRVVVAK